MKRAIFLALLLCCVVAAGTCGAYTVWDYEAVNADGTGSNPLVGADPIEASRITIEGIALAGFDELWNPAQMYTAFVQDDTAPRGGMQAWAGKSWYGTSWRPLADYPDFQAGDRVRVTGLIDDHNGKVFINDRHSAAPDTRWTLTVLGHPGLPDPELLPSVSNCNYFDHNRADGGERYQTRLVMLHGVEVTAGNWAGGSQVAVADGSGSVDMRLAVMGNFTGSAQPVESLNVVGIMDQEDTVAPFVDSYRVILKKYEDIALALDACRQARDHQGERVALVNKVVSRVYDGFFYIQDADRTGGIKVISSREFEPGDVISVHGTVSMIEGEAAITPRYLTLSKAAPKPLLVNSKTLWGDGGLDVEGLLIRCAATVGTDQGDGTWTFTDDGGMTILAKTNGTVMPEAGTRVSITAVATRNTSGMPVLLIADWHDVQIVE